MSELAIIARITALPGKRDEVVAIFSEMVEAVRSEVGTTVYALHTQADDDVTVWFYDRYTGQDALAVHGASDAMKATNSRLKGLLAGRPEIFMLAPGAAKGV